MENKQTFFEQQPVVREPGLLDVRQQTPDVLPVKEPKFRWMWLVFAITFIAVIVAILINFQRRSNKNAVNDSSAKTQDINLSNVSPSAITFTMKENDRVEFNGQLQANEGIVLTPTSEPTASVIGQIYLDDKTSRLRYYDGTTYLNLAVDDGQLCRNNDPNCGFLQTASIANLITQAQTVNLIQSAVDGIVIPSLSLPQDLAITASPQFAGINFKNGAGGVVTLQSSASSGTLTFTLPSADGIANQCLQTDGAGILSFASCASGVGAAFIQGGNSFGATAVLGTNDPNDLSFETNNLTQATLAVGGAMAFKNSTDSTTAFQVQNTAGSTIFDVDTTNSRVGIGTAAPSYDLSFGAGANRTIGIETQATNVAGDTLTIQAGAGGSGATGVNGGDLLLSAGNAAGTSGSGYGGDVWIEAGNGINGGGYGYVRIATNSGWPFFNFSTPDGFAGKMGCGVFAGACSITSSTGIFGGSGNISIDAATPSSGTAGTLSLGTTAASAITIGRTGITTTNSGALTVSQLLTGNLGATISGAITSINASSNYATNINTGTSTGLVTIGGGSGTFSLQTTNIDISSAGAISGVTEYTQASGAFAFSGGGNFSVDSAAFDVTTAGAVSGVTTLTTSGFIYLGALEAYDVDDSYAVCREASTKKLTACDPSTNGPPFLQGGNSFAATAVLGTNDAYGLTFETQNLTQATLAVGGAMTFQNTTDSTSGFRVMDQDGGNPVLNVDTTNERVGIGTAAPSYDLSFGDIAGATTARTIGVQTQSTVATGGNGLTVTSGTGNTTGAGGLLTLQAGAGGATGIGGAIAITGGAAGGGNTAGGALTVTSGAGSGSGASGNITLALGAPGATGTNGTITLQGTAPSSVAGNGTAAATFLSITSVAGGATSGTTGQTGGIGGAISLTLGAGGDANGATGNNTGGAGGAFLLQGGTGGATASTGNSAVAGAGSTITIKTGTGGAETGTTGTTRGGAGGLLTLQAGAGGTGSGATDADATGGAGGTVAITAGAGGQAGMNGGNGGGISLQAGAGGDGTVWDAYGTGGLGGSISLSAGNGGTANYGNTGGAITLQAGTGGYYYPGGAVTINAGTGGGGDGLDNPGSGADMTLQGGDAGAGTIGSVANGGNIILKGGTAYGTGTPGGVIVKNDANSATAFQIQNAAGTNQLKMGTSAPATLPNLATNGSIEQDTTGWSARTGTTMARTSTYAYKGNYSLSADTNANSEGVNYAITLSSSTQYTATFLTRVSAGSGAILEFGYARDGSTETTCKTGQTIPNTTGWRLQNCTFSTGIVSGSPYFFIRVNDATSRTLYIDGFQIVAGANAGPYGEGTLDIDALLTGTLSLRSKEDTSSAFSVQTNDGRGLFSVDTNRTRIGIGLDKPTALLDIAVVNNSDDMVIIRAGDASFTGYYLSIQDSTGLQAMFINNSGQTTFKTLSDNTSGFRVQNAAGSTIFNVDTSNSKVGTPDTATASTNSNAFVLQSGNASGTTSNSGNVTIDVGSATGTLGVINVGTTNALTVTIGKSGATLTVNSNATFNGTITVGGHVISANTSGTTTIAAGAAACTTPTVMTVTGNDTAGLISVTTGTGCVATGTLATVTFANTYGVAPRVIFTPTNAGATGLTYYNGAAGTTTFTLDTNTIPTDATSYTYNYFVIQ